MEQYYVTKKFFWCCMKNISRKKHPIFLFLVIVLMVGLALFIHDKLSSEKNIHYHSGFQVYVDGVSSTPFLGRRVFHCSC